MSRCIIMYHDVSVYLKMRPSNHTKMSDSCEDSRKDRGMAAWLLHVHVQTQKGCPSHPLIIIRDVLPAMQLKP